MSTENDTLTGGGELSMDDAVKAYVNATSEAATGQAEEETDDEGDTTDDQIASDEDGIEEEGEAEDEGQADAEDEDEPASDEGRFVAKNGKVKLPDGTVATVEDLVAGNLRDRDYRQKTMEIAEQRRSYEAQSSTIKQQEQQLAQEREYVASLMQSIKPQEPDPSLAQTDPYAYTVQKAQFDQWAQHQNYLASQQQAAKQQAEQETRAQRETRQKQEWDALLEKMPALKEEKRLNAFVSDIKSFGTKAGFSLEEIGEALASDHRMALVMRGYIAWEKLQANKPKTQAKIEGRPPIQKSGKRLTQGEQSQRSTTVAMNRLKQSGSVDDAARAYLLSQRKG